MFGGTPSAVNEWLVTESGNNLWPAFYMMIAVAIGMLALLKVPETTRCPINGTEIPGTPEAPQQLDYGLADGRC